MPSDRQDRNKQLRKRQTDKTMQSMNQHRHGQSAGAPAFSPRAVKPAYTATFTATWTTSTHLGKNVFWTIHQRPRGADS
ncbi:MAG: hypothetical protein HOM54_02850 [Actinobacteria bacterium]|nr:hypothetical protein [Actinomycetota bacterium]MBT7606117.1 hypothetical protein [Actinomycetota bacterium]MBT7893584.1 hypothetical protein [Actinomycetota bacterium]